MYFRLNCVLFKVTPMFWIKVIYFNSMIEAYVSFLSSWIKKQNKKKPHQGRFEVATNLSIFYLALGSISDFMSFLVYPIQSGL